MVESACFHLFDTGDRARFIPDFNQIWTKKVLSSVTKQKWNRRPIVRGIDFESNTGFPDRGGCDPMFVHGDQRGRVGVGSSQRQPPRFLKSLSNFDPGDERSDASAP